MEKVIDELKGILETYSKTLRNIPEQEFSSKPLPHKWSKKEVIGHLIDSAQNNLRRFICGQDEEQPPKITYEQDFWVKSNNYRERKSADVINLWVLINEQICAVLRSMPPTEYLKEADTGQLHTLQWLA